MGNKALKERMVSKFEKRLIKSAKEARAIARGELAPFNAADYLTTPAVIADYLRESVKDRPTKAHLHLAIDTVVRALSRMQKPKKRKH